MIVIKNALFGIIIILLIMFGSGCLSTPQELMPVEVTPTSISPEGGGHDKDCTFCHIQYSFRPKCTDCHELVHGTQLQDCKECHDEHAPLDIISSTSFETSCSQCHPQQIEEFTHFPGRHADLMCTYCHPSHRQTQMCSNCHAPHRPELKDNDCLNCHPAHMPRDINYSGSSIPREHCAICHEGASTALEQSNTEHTILECAYCHPVHKHIPECMDCHTPHASDMTNSDCLGCHPAHDPAVINIPPGITRNDCAICHEAIDTELRSSNTKHDDLNCVYCHPKHGYLPTCESCHGLPHQKFVHEDYPVCMQCHIVSHDVKKIVFTK